MSNGQRVRFVCVKCERAVSVREFTLGRSMCCNEVVVSDDTGYEQEFKRQRAAKKGNRNEEAT